MSSLGNKGYLGITLPCSFASYTKPTITLLTGFATSTINHNISAHDNIPHLNQYCTQLKGSGDPPEESHASSGDALGKVGPNNNLGDLPPIEM